MTICFGVDFHPRQQTICYRDAADGEVRRQELYHERDDVSGFYARFTGEVIVGLEASGGCNTAPSGSSPSSESSVHREKWTI